MPKKPTGTLDDKVKSLVDKIVDDLGVIQDWTPAQSYEAAKMIVTTPEIAKKIASGNLSFLKQAVNFYDSHYAQMKETPEKFNNYSTGIKNTLMKALPYQWGQIAASSTDAGGAGIRIYNHILEDLRNLRGEGTSINTIIGLAREVIEDPNLKQVECPANILSTISLILGKYDRLLSEKGIGEAQDYIKGKANGSDHPRIESLTNLLSKTYLPALTGYLSKHPEL